MAKATFDLVVSSMRISSVFVALLSLCISVQAKANFTVWVTRRLSNDLYQFNSAVAHLTCDSRARTYLINEKECALDANILSGIATFD